MELVEAIDSLSWKHWKNIQGGIDYNNFKIELVDVWHFVMSELLIYYDGYDLADFIIKNSQVTQDQTLPLIWDQKANQMLNDICQPYEKLVETALEKESDDVYFGKMIQEFFVCIQAAGLSFEELYQLYVGKNVLNIFRQDNGYKEGTYIKIWNNREDNVVMQAVLEEIPEVSYDNVYNALQKAYNKIK